MKERLQRSLQPEGFSKKRSVLKKAAIRLVPVSVLVFAGCSGGGGVKNSSFQELENRNSSGYELPFPRGETWFLTNGPHADGYSGIKNAIDIAPPEGGFCPPDGRTFTIENRVVTASASGEVIIKGDDINRNDPDHSVIHIKNKNGLTQVYIHLDNTRVKLGDKVNQGTPLGNPSCEYPPRGANTGPHVHVGLMKDGQPIPIDGAVVGGWTIHEGVNGEEGTMTKDGEKTRTADKGRYGKNSTGIRNDLPNNPNKAVVASPKSPISPISGSVKEKSISAPPTPKPTETPKPVVVEKQPKSLDEQAKLLALDNFLNLLSKTQEAEVDYFGNKSLVTLDSKIVQDMSASKTDVMQGKQAQDSDRLLVRWNTSALTKWGTSKNLGEAEIKGMQIQLASQPITRAEQANGIQWKGKVQINYLAHWRFVLPFFTDGRGYSGSKREWTIATSQIPQIPAGLPFSPWTERQWPDALTLTNGRWTSSNDQPTNEIDTRVLYPLEMYSITGDERSNPCTSTFGGSTPGCLELELGSRPERIFTDYSSPTLPYRLRHAEDWIVDTKTSSNRVVESFTSPYDPQEQVKIVRQIVKHGTTTEQYGKIVDQEMCELWGCSDTRNFAHTTELITSEPFSSQLNGAKVYFLFLNRVPVPGEGALISGFAYAFVKNEYGWIVLSGLDSQRTLDSEKTRNKILDSFKFTQ